MAQSDILRQQTAAGVRTAEIDAGLRAHMNKIYGTMSVGLVVTGLVAWALAGLAVTESPTQYMVRDGMYLTDLGYALYASPLKWVIMFAPLAFVFGLGAGINRLSTGAAQMVFYAFAAVMGASLSSIFLVYTSMSIAQVFFATAIGFAGLSLWGYTTKKDISGWGSFLFMGVIGIFAASLINIFLQSSALMFAVSAIGVLVFAGLTAYDTQRLKNEYLMAVAHPQGQSYLGKAAIMGALSLYINFINMFMMLLSLFGNRE
ncbi:Bax inhibitor-1/YccA family protein [Roseobacter sp. HKCCA0434]|uniref:Bax inhibitor-1/YccA family protein n=1 Tax=Roseobacter sp. HKCCA0434 TaxID=3079297 RepID=UPI002905EB60|nr:Bax inhibitor-1/YccA family protein [Roseobacter sp. HKCCA0434]